MWGVFLGIEEGGMDGRAAFGLGGLRGKLIYLRETGRSSTGNPGEWDSGN